MAGEPLPLGKLPIPLLRRFLEEVGKNHPDVVVGPGIGVDAAVIRFGETMLVFKTDPITFATDDIAWYLVTVNANDICCMGGIPEYLLVTMLLPRGSTTEQSVHDLFVSLKRACDANEVTLVGGHTEVTHGIDRPIAVGFMVGSLSQHGVVRASDAGPGDVILMSKAVPIEAVSLLAREFPHRLDIDEETLAKARNLIYDPGISVRKEALIAMSVGGVTAMHDPTEGGIATGLYELACATRCGIRIDGDAIPVIEHARAILPVFGMDPLGALASGTLLVCCRPESAQRILDAWAKAGIPGTLIGTLTARQEHTIVRQGKQQELTAFDADEVTKAFS
ncbi:MAG TPA: AIR synthase-related protein [Deltaproteobacteria bacterium]|nr:AIR synthase-related protein [Deltaproteobacteria bacterium]HOM29658.1 AIR synthase-related protein [Deltaproteobacteria bacterium]HPP81018.1 AIR synthase-related protein [Deltaproteobacteria bacterium]